MADALDIITDALRMIGVYAAGDNVTDADAVTAGAAGDAAVLMTATFAASARANPIRPNSSPLFLMTALSHRYRIGEAL